MRCVILSVVLLIVLSPTAALAGTVDGDFHCNRDIQRTVRVLQMPDGPITMLEPHAARRATSITLNPDPVLAANAQALATWNDAVALWETVLGDNVSVTINGFLAALPAGVLGSTGSSTWQNNFTAMRDLVVADRAGDESICASLPTAAQFNPDLPNFPVGFSYDGNARATRAQLSALGVDMNGVVDPGGADADITFSTGFLPDFDFDPSDGITAGKLDFFAIVVHEIGHALGFTSNVDLADFYVNQGTPIAFGPTIMDMFRINPGQGGSFSTTARIQTHGGEVSAQTFYDGLVERRLSTGAYNGDGRQASHWRADEISGTTIGIMDPTISGGQLGKLTNSDVRAFGLIGWDVIYLADCNGNDIGDQFDIWAGDEEDFNLNGIPDSCEATDAPLALNAFVAINPNPFNPRTEIKLTLSSEARARVAVYDLAGRHIDTLADRGYGAGEHSVIWEGKDSTGRGVSSGVYFVLVDIDGEIQRHKVALVR